MGLLLVIIGPTAPGFEQYTLFSSSLLERDEQLGPFLFPLAAAVRPPVPPLWVGRDERFPFPELHLSLKSFIFIPWKLPVSLRRGSFFVFPNEVFASV